MWDDFILYALAAGSGLAVVTGVLGCFVVWRRMAYFGDSLAHSALLGVALGLLYHFSVNLGILLVCSMFAALLVWLQHKRVLSTDALLGILAHAGLSGGIIALSLLEGAPVDLFAYLFGDVLSVTARDVYWIYGGATVVLATLVAAWPSLVLMTVNEDLARAEGVPVFLMQLLLVALMTAVVAVSIHLVGILLITALLIIPAATARQLTNSPEAMALAAATLGVAAVITGVTGSVWLDVPTGPGIVATASLLFAVSTIVAAALPRKRKAEEGAGA